MLMDSRRAMQPNSHDVRLHASLRQPAGVFVGAQFNRLLVTGEATSLTSGTITKSVTDRGFAASITTGADTRLRLAADADTVFTSTSAATVAVLRRCRDTTARAATVFGYNAGSLDRVLLHGPFSDGTLYWDYGTSTAGSGRISVAFTKTTSWETLVCVAGPKKGREVWRNATRIAANTSATGTRSATTAALHLGAAATGLSADNEDIALIVFSMAEWSDGEILAWAGNPFGRTFSKRRRLWAHGFAAPAAAFRARHYYDQLTQVHW